MLVDFHICISVPLSDTKGIKREVSQFVNI